MVADRNLNDKKSIKLQKNLITNKSKTNQIYRKMRQGLQADFLMKDKTASEGTKRATKGDDILSEGLTEEGHLREGGVAAEGTRHPWHGEDSPVHRKTDTENPHSVQA